MTDRGKGPAPKRGHRPGRRARSLLSSATLAVAGTVGLACEDAGPEVISNPKGSWFDSGLQVPDASKLGDAEAAKDAAEDADAEPLVDSANPKGSWYDAGLEVPEEDAGDAGDADDAGED